MIATVVTLQCTEQFIHKWEKQIPPQIPFPWLNALHHTTEMEWAASILSQHGSQQLWRGGLKKWQWVEEREVPAEICNTVTWFRLYRVYTSVICWWRGLRRQEQDKIGWLVENYLKQVLQKMSWLWARTMRDILPLISSLVTCLGIFSFLDGLI